MTETPVGKVRLAEKADISSIVSLIRENPDTILPRTKAEIEELLETTWVAEEAGKVVGCCCLEVYSKKISEVRTLAVKKEFQGRGYGRRLVAEAVAEATRRKIPQILTITSSVSFFEKLDFGPCLREKFALFWRGTSGVAQDPKPLDPSADSKND